MAQNIQPITNHQKQLLSFVGWQPDPQSFIIVQPDPFQTKQSLFGSFLNPKPRYRVGRCKCHFILLYLLTSRVRSLSLKQWRCSFSTNPLRATPCSRFTASTKSARTPKRFGTPFRTSTGSAKSLSFAPSTLSLPLSMLSNSATPSPKVTKQTLSYCYSLRVF